MALILDDTELTVGSSEPFEVVRPPDVLPSDELARMLTSYGLVEFATAVKPALLIRLLETDDVVAYFDPDIQVFAQLNDLFSRAAESGVVLTPHATEPLPTSGHSTGTEDVVLDGGVFNLGFIAVGQRALAALDWWDSKLRRQCVIDPGRSRFVDQRWIDLFPGYFQPYISRDPGLNVAWWNLPTRTLRPEGATITVDDHPLRFFHFSGYRPEQPWMLSTHQGRLPRVLLSERPEVKALTDAYRAALLEHDYEQVRDIPYGLDTTAGSLSVDSRMRFLYRRALASAERAGRPEPPRLYDQPDEDFLKWLSTPDEPADGPWAVGRYLHEVWRSDAHLQQQFPDPHRDDAQALFDWAVTEGVQTGRVPARLAATLVAPPIDAPGPFSPGVHLIVVGAESPGHALIAEDIRALLEEQSIPVSRTELPTKGGPPSTAPRGDPRETNVFIVQPQRLSTAIHMLPPSYCRAPVNVALIWSEDEDVELSEHCMTFLDELWVLNSERAEALRADPDMPPVELIGSPVASQGSSGPLLIVDCAWAPDRALPGEVASLPPDFAVIALRADHPSQGLEYVKWLVAQGRAAHWTAGSPRDARDAMRAASISVQLGGPGEPPIPPTPDHGACGRIADTPHRVLDRRRAAAPSTGGRWRLRTGS